MRNAVLSRTTVNLQAEAASELLSGGFIEVYDGQQPDNVDTDLLYREPLAILRLPKPAFTSAEDGVIYMRPVAPVEVQREGIATWCRLFMSDHKTRVLDCSVGLTDANMLANITELVPGVTLSVSGYSHRIPMQHPGM